MAAIGRALLTFTNFCSNSLNLTAFGFQQVRNKHYGRWMKRDIKRRKLAEDYAIMRLRLVAMKRNNILPPEFQQHVAKEIDETIPRQSALRQLTKRCVISSRPRGVLHRWRLSRFIFRHLVDYNKIAGIQRAVW